MRRRHANRLPAAPGQIQQQPSIPSFIASAIAPKRAQLKDGAAVNQLAEDMRAAYHREGGISHDELLGLGWTAAQLGSHAEKARSRAQHLADAGV